MPPAPSPFAALRNLCRSSTRHTNFGIRYTRPPIPQQRSIAPLSKFLRYNSTSASTPTESSALSTSPLTSPPSTIPTTHHKPRSSRAEYELTFTCKPCSTRSRHRVSKQGYHHGSVLITCPECRNRHVISDHLGIFGDKNLTIEDLMREQGQLVKRGTLSEDGDLEFWADGTQTKRGNSDLGATPSNDKK